MSRTGEYLHHGSIMADDTLLATDQLYDDTYA
jgi:hypothetical protein